MTLAGSQELFLNLLIRATCKQERKRPSLCRGEMALWSNTERLEDLHLILGCATDPPVSPELSQPRPGLLPPSRHPAPFNNSSSPHSPSTQPASDSHQHQHPGKTPGKWLENQPAQPQPQREPGLLVPKIKKGICPQALMQIPTPRANPNPSCKLFGTKGKARIQRPSMTLHQLQNQGCIWKSGRSIPME